MRNILFFPCLVTPLVLLGGGVFHLSEGNLEVRDYWSSEEAALHISTKEMLALHRVFQSSAVELRNCRVDVNVDSQILLDTWIPRSPQLTAATKDVFHHRQPKLTPRESEEFKYYLWFSSRDVTFERDRCWVTSGR